jgi:hypothetical protein
MNKTKSVAAHVASLMGCLLLMFATSGMAAPPAPTLSYPKEGASVNTGVNIPFAWYGTGTNYRIVISQNRDFSGFSDANGSSSCTNDTCFTATTSSKTYSKSVSCKGQTYYWKVRANDSTGASGFSAPRSFKTSGSPSCTLATKVGAFVEKYTNYFVDFYSDNGTNSNQCTDLAWKYAQEVLGFSEGTLVRADAIDIFYNTNNSKFTRVYNSSSGVPQKGDIVFWNKHSANTYHGHVAIFISGDTNKFKSFDQNWANEKDPTWKFKPRTVDHDYTSAGGVVGWLHPNL